MVARCFERWLSPTPYRAVIDLAKTEDFHPNFYIVHVVSAF